MQACPSCGTNIAIAPQLYGQSVVCPICAQAFIAGQSRSFDPYYTWLGIPPDEQPPNHYRLLGLRLFEANAKVIDNAADRQMRHLHALRTGEHARESQRLLTEVASARICLLEPSQKAAYDEELRRSLAVPAPHYANYVAAAALPQYAGSAIAQGSSTTSSSPVSSQPLPQFSSAAAPVYNRARNRRRPRSQSSAVKLVGIVVGGLIGLAMGVLVVFYITGHDFLGLSAKLQHLRSGSARAATGQSKPINTSPPKALPMQQVALPSTAPDFSRKENTPLPESRGSQPPSPPVPAPAPPIPRLLFTRASATISLPPLGSDSPILLFTLPSEIEGPLQFALRASAADLPEGVTPFVEPSGDGWNIGSATAESEKQLLAEIRQEGLQLAFAWTSEHPDSPLRAQLSNCLLEVNVDAKSHVIQLREPYLTSRLMLDLDVNHQEVQFEVQNCPPKEKLFVKVLSLNDFTGGAKLRKGIGKQGLDKRLFIEFDDLPGAEIELRMWRRPSTGHLLVRLDPVFREQSDKEPLTRPRLKDVEQASRAVVTRGLSDLTSGQARLRTLNSELESTIAWVPSTRADRDTKIVKLANLRRQIQGLSNDIGDLQRQMAKHQTRLAAVPTIRTFMESLHKRAAIIFLIGADCGDRELILVDGSGAAVEEHHEERHLFNVLN